MESLGLFEESPEKTVAEVALAMLEALSLRTASLDVDEIKPDGQEGAYVIDKQKVRCRFGLRFGDVHDDSTQVLNRAGSVRSAFNSPFRPFIRPLARAFFLSPPISPWSVHTDLARMVISCVDIKSFTPG